MGVMVAELVVELWELKNLETATAVHAADEDLLRLRDKAYQVAGLLLRLADQGVGELRELAFRCFDLAERTRVRWEEQAGLTEHAREVRALKSSG